jgi:lactoylglutathione lyase
VRTLHVGLRVSDLERSLPFYATLGYEVLGDAPETEFGSLTMLKLPGDEFVTLAPTSPDSSHEFGTAWVTDPDRYRLELVRWPREHPDGMTRSDFAKPDDEDG